MTDVAQFKLSVQVTGPLGPDSATQLDYEVVLEQKDCWEAITALMQTLYNPRLEFLQPKNPEDLRV